VKEYVHSRWEFLHTSSMGFAYLLNPRNQGGSSMDGTDCEDTIQQLSDYMMQNKEILGISASVEDISSEIVSVVTVFADPSPNDVLSFSKFSALQWWTILGRKKFPNVYKVAKQIFKIPTSSAASERIWSVFNFVCN
jgi:proteasome lid subunit RPN8/RPN11